MSSPAGSRGPESSHRWLLWMAIALCVVAAALFVAIYALLVHASGATGGRAAYISLGAFATFGIPALIATVLAIVVRRRARPRTDGIPKRP